ncbi:MAG: hypothetical protein U9Q81_03540 [Pseudomonadota bacterium]|nr:hypothetical protein [Pseudomonadota bacterium]
MKLLTTSHFCGLVCAVGFDAFNRSLIRALEEDFSRWERFHRSPRHAVHYPHGVIELMPTADDSLFFKRDTSVIVS